MNLDTIISGLTDGARLPKDELAAAHAHKADVTDRLLALLQAETAAPGEGDADLSAPLLLLGEWREPRAYPLLCELMACPADAFEGVFLDIISNHLDAVLAAIYDGDPQPLFEGVVDDSLDEEASVAFLGALVRLVHAGRVERPALEAFLADIFPIVSADDASFVGHAWTKAVSALGFKAMQPRVKQLFQGTGVINVIGSYAEFEADMKATALNPSAAFGPDATYYQPLTSALDVMQTWTWPDVEAG